MDKRAGVDIEIKENNIIFYSNPLDFSGTKRLAVLENSEDIKIELGNDKRVKASVPIEERILEDFSLERGFESGYNCDLKKIGSVLKENDGTKMQFN